MSNLKRPNPNPNRGRVPYLDESVEFVISPTRRVGGPGLVYVLSNPAMPGIVKIGMTTKAPLVRAEELHTTGVPTPFKVEFAIHVPDAVAVEKDCHTHFSRHRVSNDREFFRVEPCVVALFVVRRIELLDGFAIVSSDEDTSLAEIGLSMSRVSPRRMHPVEVAAALELLTEDELRTLALRYEARNQQLLAAEAECATDGN